ncbi:RNA polymerase subunit [Lumpy skin disease virus]|uniref:DNA-directed RNA polymerase 19 kDa subunit n=1 Tax=Lumpy skin disease virus TaxID=59509 RepID=A0A1C9HHF9_LSDV|nr:RNA polymerase subunit [Lumpy skin disease virus]AOO78656.1 RNA polymerase subunit [Lumpy skin disease virus]AOO78815.1 RNA polymerase subunit [Lumpy skin disease virus]AOO78973.1 RNA polymerase subunit [Lumpy skin disease virus]AVR51533.1 RNA polymerase subunit [Lumpy skin disease virus]
MAESDDIIDDYISDEDASDEFEEEEEEEESLETSDVPSLKQSNYKVGSSISINIEDTNQQNITNASIISSKISAIKKRYTRRISLFEITGIIAESYNLLQRGRMPLVLNLSDDTMKQKILHIVIEEIKEGTCPIIIEKNGELLSVTDFDKKGLYNHLDYIINIWKKQNRF